MRRGKKVLSHKTFLPVVQNTRVNESPNGIVLRRISLLILFQVINLLLHDCLLSHQILNLIPPVIFAFIVSNGQLLTKVTELIEPRIQVSHTSQIEFDLVSQSISFLRLPCRINIFHQKLFQILSRVVAMGQSLSRLLLKVPVTRHSWVLVLFFFGLLLQLNNVASLLVDFDD